MTNLEKTNNIENSRTTVGKRNVKMAKKDTRFYYFQKMLNEKCYHDDYVYPFVRSFVFALREALTPIPPRPKVNPKNRNGHKKNISRWRQKCINIVASRQWFRGDGPISHLERLGIEPAWAKKAIENAFPEFHRIFCKRK